MFRRTCWILGFSLWSAWSVAAPSVIDTGFGVGGYAQAAMPGSPSHGLDSDLLRLPDARVLVSTLVMVQVLGEQRLQVGLTMYDRDGALDTRFSVDGHAFVDFSSGVSGSFEPVVVATGDRLYVGATTGNLFALARLSLDGSLDTSFGQGGKITTGIPSTPAQPATNILRSIAVDSDGSIFLVGDAVLASVPRFVAVRLRPDGQPDTAFGNLGGTIVGNGLAVITPTFAAVDAHHRLLVAGNVGNDLFAARLTPQGLLDGDFAGGGIAEYDLADTTPGSVKLITGTMLPDDGAMLLGAMQRPESDANPADAFLLGLTRDGSTDGSFGVGGVSLLATQEITELPRLLVRQSDGWLVGGVLVASGNQFRPYLMRTDRAGHRDFSFGTNGIVFVPTPTPNLVALPSRSSLQAEPVVMGMSRETPDTAPLIVTRLLPLSDTLFSDGFE